MEIGVIYKSVNLS